MTATQRHRTGFSAPGGPQTGHPPNSRGAREPLSCARPTRLQPVVAGSIPITAGSNRSLPGPSRSPPGFAPVIAGVRPSPEGWLHENCHDPGSPHSLATRLARDDDGPDRGGRRVHPGRAHRASGRPRFDNGSRPVQRPRPGHRRCNDRDELHGDCGQHDQRRLHLLTNDSHPPLHARPCSSPNGTFVTESVSLVTVIQQCNGSDNDAKHAISC